MDDSKLVILKSSTSFGPLFIHVIDIKVSPDSSCSVPHTRAEWQHSLLTNNWVEHVGGFFTYTMANNAIICSTDAPGGTRKACHLTKKGPRQETCPSFHAQAISDSKKWFNPLNPELNPICYLLALLGAHHFFHISRIRVKSLTLRLLMSYIWSTYSWCF